MKTYINNFTRLKDYALWYYFRYYPSNRKIEQKLEEKTGNDRALVQEVLGSIKHLFQEEEIIRTKISHFLFRNKNLNYIRQNLAKKLFPREKIEQILLAEFLEEGKSVLQKKKLLKKIENYFHKGKSKRYVYSQLVERQEDKEIVEECIYDIYGEEGELCILEGLIKKEKEKGIKQEKIIEKLLRKGFHYDFIKQSCVE